ncbi:MAG: ABC transporter ATP-binding protein [Syntrophales bacterium]|jgi:branched-chain amino acid transport system ATP-binding protein|nr:ABC transporter ATP-binding protein [Syntrophales bacterium]
MIRVENICSYYGEFQSLHDVSLEVKAGHTVIIVGSNGAGKTTILKSICGLVHPRSGAVYFEDKRIDQYHAHQLVDLGITMVPEGGRLFPKLTVDDNLKIGAYNKNARIHFHESLEKVHSLFPILKERAKQEAGLLSGGERQMVAIARSLMACPKLIMLDEPSLGLAPKVVSSVFEFIRRLKESNYSVLLVEQNANKALEVADYGYLIESGKLIFEGKKEDFDKNPFIKKAYLGL